MAISYVAMPYCPLELLQECWLLDTQSWLAVFLLGLPTSRPVSHSVLFISVGDIT